MERQQALLPEISFWKTDSGSLKIVNKEDFLIGDFLKIIGLDNSPLRSSFGSSDSSEVLRRQEIVRFLHNNPRIRRFIEKRFHTTSIPDDGSRFMDHFNPDLGSNPFIRELKILSSMVNKSIEGGGYSLEIVRFAKMLKEKIAEIEERENAFARAAIAEIEKSSKIQGVFDVKCTVRDSDAGYRYISQSSFTGQGYGYKLYDFENDTKFFKIFLQKPDFESIDEDNRKKAKIVYYSKLFFSVLFFPIGLFIFIHNYRTRSRKKEARIVSHVPKNVVDDTINALDKMLDFYDEENKGESKLLIPETRNCYLSLKVYYEYDAYGLKIRILKVSSLPYNDEDRSPSEKEYLEKTIGIVSRLQSKDIPVFDPGFSGYPESYKNKIHKSNLEMFKVLNSELFYYKYTKDFLLHVQTIAPKLLMNLVNIDSPQTDRDFKCYSVHSVCGLDSVKDLYSDVVYIRNYFRQIIFTLRNISDAVVAIQSISKKWGIPISYPKILPDDQHLVRFDKIYPTHIIGRPKRGGEKDAKVESSDIKPISLKIPLNGQVMGITGTNAGGKTTMLVEMSYLIFMAQSGFPVFGEGVEMNVKKQIGLVFSTRGEGSTLELVLQKTKNVLDAINIECNPNTCVVLLDELGIGTQEITGLKIGKSVLKKLADKHVSTMFNTQITELAEYSDKDLGGVNFKFDKNYEITPGIGTGNAEVLTKKIGLDKILDIN